MNEATTTPRTALERALVYASQVHAGQRRKETEIPYLSHLISACALVMEAGGGEEEQIAALLHDAVEDRGGLERLEEIRAIFGDRVADLVMACTDDVDRSVDWYVRKKRYLEHLADPRTDEGMLRVSNADKLHNARAILADLRVHGDALWARFNRGVDKQLWYYRGLAGAFTARGTFHAAELDRVVGEIERLAGRDEEAGEGEQGG